MSPPSAQPSRQLGQAGPKIPEIGFGLMGLSVAYGQVPPDQDRLALLDRAWELGETNWDTADCYADSEDLVGKWFKLHPERRRDIFLATKFGIKPDETGKSALGLVEDSSPEHCRAAVQKSLKRLQTDYIDLYYVHRISENMPIERTMRVLKELQDQDTIKHIGLSEASGATLRRAHAIAPVAATQVEYSPWALEIEGEASGNVKQVCHELGIAIFCYSPLGRGILTGQYRSVDDFEPNDARRSMARYQGDNMAKNLALVDKFKDMADKKGCTAGQLVLAWLLGQGDQVFVIPGTKKVEYLEQNLQAANVRLTEDEQQALRKLVQEGDVQGDRSNWFGSYVDTVEE